MASGPADEKEGTTAPAAQFRVPVELSEEDLSLNFCPAEPIHCWKKLSSCEEFVGTKRSKHTIVAWNDKVYVFGGDNGRRMLNDFLVSHIRDSSWARVVYTGKHVCVCEREREREMDGVLLCHRLFTLMLQEATPSIDLSSLT